MALLQLPPLRFLLPPSTKKPLNRNLLRMMRHMLVLNLFKKYFTYDTFKYFTVDLLIDTSSLDISGLRVGSSQEESEEEKDGKIDTKTKEVGWEREK